VDLVYCDDEVLPFADASFDLVINRHAGLDPGDIGRILRSSGSFYTEQISSAHWGELQVFFPRTTAGKGNNYFSYLVGLRSAGLDIVEARAYSTLAAFKSLGDFVFMLCITPWTIPDFDPLDADLEALLQLERTLSTPDGLVLSPRSFLDRSAKARFVAAVFDPEGRA
jgi:hypothetical protein